MGLRYSLLGNPGYLWMAYWWRGLSLKKIAAEVGCSSDSSVRFAMQRLEIPTRRRGVIGFGRRPNGWKGGVVVRNGYIKVLVPEHPDSDGRGYIHQHRLVMERSIGRRLRTEEVVHHRNRDRADNRIQNLQLCANNAEHRRIHAEEDRATKAVKS